MATSSIGPRAVLRTACDRFGAGQFDFASREDAASVLKGEGLKRLESFLFEWIFQRCLGKYCPDLPVAHGWSVVSRHKGEPELWIKLQMADLNAADQALLAFLDTTDCAVLKVCYCDQTRTFLGAWRAGRAWQAERQLGSLLQDKYGMPDVVKEPENKYFSRAQAALNFLLDKQEPGETRSLVLSRMLINCFIVPYCKVQPMDIDAVVVNGSGDLHFLEFKRKYPSRDGLLSLDELPHVALAKWLLKRGKTLSPLVFCDPLWDKLASPMHLIETNDTRPFAYWLGMHLTPTIMASGIRLTTSGADSGMNSGQRHQLGFTVDHYVVIGRSLRPDALLAFLNHEKLPAANVADLEAARDAARAARQNAGTR